MIEQMLVDADYEKYGTESGNGATDKVYLASLADMQNGDYGFSSDEEFRDQARIGKTTAYARQQGVSTSSWWLRSPDYTNCLYVVSHQGDIDIDGDNIFASDMSGIRPALHLDLSSPLVQSAGKLEISIKSVSWDTVELGNYEGSPILWRVLEVSEGSAYLLADRILTRKAYNDEVAESTWKDSTLRAWLNEEFYQEVFTEDEKKGIELSVYENPDNLLYGTEGGEDTKDFITLLSWEDVVKKEYGFPTDYLCAHPARKACTKGDEDGSRWWLRSPGYQPYTAAFIQSVGNMHTYGDLNLRSNGIRPALHYKLSSYFLRKTGMVTADISGVTYNRAQEISPTTTENPTEPTTVEKLTEPATTENPTASTTADKSTVPITTETPTTSTTTEQSKKDNPTTLNIANKKTYKTSKKVTVKDADGIKTIKINSKTIKVKNGKKSYSFKLSTYRKYLKKKGKWNKLVVTDKTGKKKMIQFKTK